MEPLSFEKLMGIMNKGLEKLPDYRSGKNITYQIKEAALGAFGTFYTQTPSFLAYQQRMKQKKGRSNAESLFGLKQIPSDNQIRNLLDPIRPSELNTIFIEVLNGLRERGVLAEYRVLEEQLLVSMDGTGYFSSQKIHCQHCSHQTRGEGETTYFHTAITPVIVKPGSNQVLSLPPEFIMPQDGHDKQDCERAAAKRWLKAQAGHFRPKEVTLLGDDLYSNQPLCQVAVDKGCHFIFVCKPESHQILYEWLDFLDQNGDIEQVTVHHWNGRFTEIATYRYVNQVPLRGGEKALMVNWGEITVTHSQTGQQLYHNAFVTDHLLNEQTVVPIVQAGRTRWKSENENNNILKNNGYHLEHNFGHGQQYLASFLLTLNLLAFLFHTILDLVDAQYRLLRQALPTRQTFFNDLRALTRYLYFDSWQHLLDFMLEHLELVSAFDTS